MAEPSSSSSSSATAEPSSLEGSLSAKAARAEARADMGSRSVGGIHGGGLPAYSPFISGCMEIRVLSGNFHLSGAVISDLRVPSLVFLLPSLRDAALVLTTAVLLLVSVASLLSAHFNEDQIFRYLMSVRISRCPFPRVGMQLSFGRVKLPKPEATATTTASSRRCPDPFFFRLLLLIQIRQCRYSRSGIRSTSRLHNLTVLRCFLL